ncbi:MAG: hypothetical protein KBC64_06295 [Simkaniaceae bacterium]|nr:hypothetical protein [Simkaniaceae bacterium]
MNIERFNFLFHPFHYTHSDQDKILSIITNIALTAITGGLYLFVFGVVHLAEYSQEIVHMPGFIGIQGLKDKQRDHLLKLQRLAQNGEWEHLRQHTAHPDSGFDWWMFPVDRGSAGQGDLYKVSSGDIDALKRDPEFIRNYRDGVILVAKSWGWDLETGQVVTTDRQKWTNYQVRLGKMLHSLSLFGQNDLRTSLIHFIDDQNLRPTLNRWIQQII